MDENAPIPNRVEQRQVFSPPFEGGVGGGELTISINLTLIDAMFLVRPITPMTLNFKLFKL